MKARCNATEQYPDPCTRCSHLGKAPCVIEPSFRRVNKRAYVPFARSLTCRRIAEIQNELEQLKNTVKQRSASMNSRESSEYSDTQRSSFLVPEMNGANGYSPGTSSFASPYATSEDSIRPVGITGRIDAKAEDELFVTYRPRAIALT
jgi:hypothetical protein